MNTTITDLYRLKPSAIWRAFAWDNFAFWMSCTYLFFEYVRPQAIWPVFQVYPYWARTFVILAFLGWLLDPNKKFVWTRISTGVFAFLILIILSSYYAYWPEESWSYFMNFFNWAVIFFVLTQTITTRQRLYVFLLIFFLASFKLSLGNSITFAQRGFAFAGWGLRGPEGFFQNPGELAIQMVIFFSMSLFFVLAIRPYISQFKACLLYLMPITAAITTIGTNTRGGQLALVAVLMAMIATTKHRIKVFIFIAILAFVGFHLLPPEQKARFELMGDDETSQQRILYWKHGWQMMKDHPVLGIGYYNFIPYYREHHIEDLVIHHFKRDQYVERPHNIIIQVGTDTGFTGLAVFLGLILAAFLRMRRISKEADASRDQFLGNMARGTNMALIGFFVAGQFVTVAYYPYLWIHLVFVTAIGTFWQSEKAAGTVSVQNAQAVRAAVPPQPQAIRL